MNKEKEFFIPKFDGFDLAFAEYHFGEKFENLRDFLNARSRTVKDTAATYRVINHWNEIGILADGSLAEGKWRKFTMVEIVWLRVVERLRTFGMPLDTIRKVKKGVLDWNKKEKRYPKFEFYIALALASTDDPYILAHSSGEADIASMGEILTAKVFYGSTDMLLISLKAILDTLHLPTTKSNQHYALKDPERKMLLSVRLENLSRLAISLEDGNITLLEKTSMHSTPSDANAEMKKNEGYGEILAKFEKGNTKSVQLIKKVKP